MTESRYPEISMERVDELTTAALALQQTVEDERRRNKWRWAGTVAVLVLGAGIFIQQRINAESLDILKDATTPGGDIYERGQAGGATFTCTIVNQLRLVHDQAPLAEIPIVVEVDGQLQEATISCPVPPARVNRP